MKAIKGLAIGGRVIDSCSSCERSNRLKEVNELRRKFGASALEHYLGAHRRWAPFPGIRLY